MFCQKSLFKLGEAVNRRLFKVASRQLFIIKETYDAWNHKHKMSLCQLQRLVQQIFLSEFVEFVAFLKDNGMSGFLFIASCSSRKAMTCPVVSVYCILQQQKGNDMSGCVCLLHPVAAERQFHVRLSVYCIMQQQKGNDMSGCVCLLHPVAAERQ